MSAGVGKTYRMLTDAHNMLKNGIDVQIGYIETHNRKETAALLDGIPIIPRRKVFYKGKELEEMDLQSILNIHPEIVIVDELAHTNVPGSKNEKRWQDVLEILDTGINVVSAVNIQHIESINANVRTITGIEVTERIPDKMLQLADEVVNIDLTADELITRLREGKIYEASKVETAIKNFFQPEKDPPVARTRFEGSGFTGRTESRFGSHDQHPPSARTLPRLYQQQPRDLAHDHS